MKLSFGLVALTMLALHDTRGRTVPAAPGKRPATPAQETRAPSPMLRLRPAPK